MLTMPDGSLLVVNAVDSDSHVAHFSTCGSDSTRTFTGDFSTQSLDHPYGITQGLVNDELFVWVSNQDTYDIIQYSSNGTYIQTLSLFNQDALRGIAFDQNKQVLYIADETQNAVLAYDAVNNQLVSSLSIPITSPVGLYIDPVSYILYIGSKNKHNSLVGAFSLSDRSFLYNYSDSTLEHPAGIALYQDQLFVLGQKAGTLLVFNTTDQSTITNSLISNFPDTVEQIIVSYC
jgi:DNA-binding beta-propeller fold protein YncE